MLRMCSTDTAVSRVNVVSQTCTALSVITVSVVTGNPPPHLRPT